MCKKINHRKITGLLCLLFFLSGTGILRAQTNDRRFEINKNLEIFNALVKELEMFYVDTLDVEKTIKRGIDGMLSATDPYTEYYPEQRMDDLKFMSTGEYGGIGAFIRGRDEGVVITEPYEGMPAALTGLKAGDLILEIDSINVQKETSDKVSELLKGVPNTKLTVKVQRHGEKKPLTFELIRKQILVDPVTYYGVKGDNVGYIYLSTFTDKSAQEVKSAFEDLKNNHGIKSLILDLRDNGGGTLESAVQIVNMFVPKGKEVVFTRSKATQWDRTYRTSIEPLDTVMPLAVLINGSTASAAEIVSGALQDMDRAVILGQRSFGKGLVQVPRELPYNSSLKVTMSKYYIPSGRCIQQLDYSHRNPDGSPATVPDSLTNVFYTENGRPVRDGGGIRPEFEIEEPKMPTMMYYLLTDYVLFDFITEWVQKHPKIALPEEFKVTDEDFEAFKAYAKEKNFSYDRQSERMLKSLKEMAEFEGYLDGDSTVFQTLESKLTPDLDRDFDRFKARIKEAMGSEIIKRYYYQKGDLIYSLQDDEVLGKALEVLADPVLIKETLSKPASVEENAELKNKPGNNRKRSGLAMHELRSVTYYDYSFV